MNPSDQKLLTLARRTRKNLEFIYAQKQQGADVYEFTQLLNSMQSMLVTLREECFRGYEVTWEAVENAGFNPSSDLRKKSTSFSKLITHLRHAFAHGNYETIGKPEITGIEVWNIPPGKENTPANRNWEDEFSETEVREVAYLFIDYLECTRGHELAP